MDRINRIKELTYELNKYRDSYYNESISPIIDKTYDDLFDELQVLEREEGFHLSNSPTQTVGYEVKSKLQKVKHNHPMLSLDKTKNVDDLISFLEDKKGVLMLKLDGLTISLRYLDGELVGAESRGNGEEGEDILHNAKVFTNIPLKIPFKGELIVDGEAIIDYGTFSRINVALDEPNKYKNPRNLASGSVRQLDSEVAAQRNVKFIAWKCIKGISDNSFASQLETLKSLGFAITPYFFINRSSDIQSDIELLKEIASESQVPIDGLVLGFDDVKYGKSLGQTGHHLKSQLAFKFYDEEVTTILRSVEWSMGKTGVLTPVAIFDSVEIDGTDVSRASLHNISICEELQLGLGDEITVYKANQIIPQIKENLTKSGSLKIPSSCPVCGDSVEITQDSDTKNLVCVNEFCKGKLLYQLKHFASKNAMNIDGLSEATLEKFIQKRYIDDYIDIYELQSGFYNDILELDGFKKKSTDKLMTAIEKSKNTTLDRFIYALSIPLIGRSASKTISNYFKGDFKTFYGALVGNFNWQRLDDFGQGMSESLKNFIKAGYGKMMIELSTYMNFQQNDSKRGLSNDRFKDLIFVITGAVTHFKNREELKETIESMGGKVTGAVSKTTSYLLNNDKDSKSSKNTKAKQLGVPIITEEELLKLMEG